MKETINIIGAGLAGLTAAIVLSKQGFSVRVYEMSSEVGYRLNGDFQGLENWSTGKDVLELLKELGIDINFPCVPYHGGIVYAPKMKSINIQTERPIFYLVKRGPMPGTLDIGLKEQALSLGVEIIFNRRLETFTGDAIVGTGPKGADAVAVGITFTTGMEDQAIVVLDDTIAPKGYAYLLINHGYGTMATVLFREFRKEKEYFKNMKRFFEDNVNLDIKNERMFGGYGNIFMRETQVHNKKIYIGEAAGFQDYLWGFGMRYAIVSGYLAAKSFTDGSDYDKLWKKELKPMIETSIVNRYLFQRLGSVGYRLLTRSAASGDPCAFLRKQYNPSFLKNLLLPLARKSYESRVKDKMCNHEDCSCVWCRCGDKACLN